MSSTIHRLHLPSNYKLHNLACNLHVSLSLHKSPPETFTILSLGKPGDEIVIPLFKILRDLVYMQNINDEEQEEKEEEEEEEEEEKEDEDDKVPPE